MAPPSVVLTLRDELLAVCRLGPAAEVPPWAWSAPFAAITRTEDELSIVCREADVPEGVRAERSWRRLVVEGPLDFALTGILAAIAGPLADAGVPLFAVSTFDTDHILIRADALGAATAALRRAGHTIRGGGDDATVPEITCIGVGVYEGALTRGRRYQMLDRDDERRQVKIRADHGRVRWYPMGCFDFEGRPVPTLVGWRFDEVPRDEADGWAEVSLDLSDGTRRWALLATPAGLRSYLDSGQELCVWTGHATIVPSLGTADVDRALRWLDGQGDLIASSLPLDPDTPG